MQGLFASFKGGGVTAECSDYVVPFIQTIRRMLWGLVSCSCLSSFQEGITETRIGEYKFNLMHPVENYSIIS